MEKIMSEVMEDIPKRYYNYMTVWLKNPSALSETKNNLLSAYLEFSMDLKVDLAKRLIALGNDPANIDSDGDPVLFCAVVNPFVTKQIIELLFEATPESFSLRNLEYENALMKYVEENRCKPEITAFLIERTKID
jgi:hypothetical protein